MHCPLPEESQEFVSPNHSAEAKRSTYQSKGQDGKDKEVKEQEESRKRAKEVPEHAKASEEKKDEKSKGKVEETQEAAAEVFTPSDQEASWGSVCL